MANLSGIFCMTDATDCQGTKNSANSTVFVSKMLNSSPFWRIFGTNYAPAAELCEGSKRRKPGGTLHGDDEC